LEEIIMMLQISVAHIGYAATANQVIFVLLAEAKANFIAAASWVAHHKAMTAGIVAVAAAIIGIFVVFKPLSALAILLFAAAAAWIAFHAASTLGISSPLAIAAVAAGLVVMSAYALQWGVKAGTGMSRVGNLPAMKFNKERSYDMGGVYLGTAEGGMLSTEHGMAQLQKGETVVSKTSNMLGGGITLNFGDINAEDGTDFAEKVAAALPDALRRANDQGAI
jgi:hypothetical protein